MKKWNLFNCLKGICLVGIFIFSAAVARAELTFFLVDNFESNSYSKWFPFGGVQLDIMSNPKLAKRDLVAESCGDYSLKIAGEASDWYVGGIGAELGIDATPYSRIQMDFYGSPTGGKTKIELYDDDNGNKQIEQDKNWIPKYDDKWSVEIPVLGLGFTRVSIPFSAFTLENPGKGDGIFNPDNKNGSGGLIRMQVIFVAPQKIGTIDLALDNILFTF